MEDVIHGWNDCSRSFYCHRCCSRRLGMVAWAVKVTMWKEVNKMNIGLWLIVIVGGAVGILSTLYCVISLVAVLAYKIYRKVVHKIPLCNWTWESSEDCMICHKGWSINLLIIKNRTAVPVLSRNGSFIFIYEINFAVMRLFIRNEAAVLLHHEAAAWRAWRLRQWQSHCIQ